MASDGDLSMPSAFLKTHELVIENRRFSVLNDISDQLLSGGLAKENTWEPWQINLYSKIIGANSVCIDIGGNIGTSALAMSHYACSGYVYTFEPVRHTCDILEENVSRNDVGNIQVINKGLSDRVGEATILVNRSLLGAAHQVVSPPATVDGDGIYTQVTEMTTLDAWAATHGISCPDLIKVDVEGFEVEVLLGGQQTFHGSTRTLAVFEFAVQAQREASLRGFPQPQKDVEFVRMIFDQWAHVFLIGRDFKLYRVSSYAEIRAIMLSGYQVEDLLCCHVVPASLNEVIAPTFCCAPQGPSCVISSGESLFFINNRYVDGWSGTSPFGRGSQSAIVMQAAVPFEVEIEFAPLVSSHAYSSQPILVSFDNEVIFVDPTDQFRSVRRRLGAGRNTIFLESEFTLPQSYLGNPADQRSIGFLFRLGNRIEAPV